MIVQAGTRLFSRVLAETSLSPDRRESGGYGFGLMGPRVVGDGINGRPAALLMDTHMAFTSFQSFGVFNISARRFSPAVVNL